MDLQLLFDFSLIIILSSKIMLSYLIKLQDIQGVV